MKLFNWLIPVLFAVFLLNCNNNSEETNAISQDSIASSNQKALDSSVADLPVGDNSETSLDWPGTYKGVLPCADCEGIETLLSLNADKTYSLKTTYLGKSNKVNEEKGSFSWNKEGNSITLASSGSPNKFFVGENNLWKLDADGKKIDGQLSDKYRLAKQNMSSNEPSVSNAALTETFWRLVEIRGKPIESFRGTRQMHIVLKNQDNRVQGFFGCNTFTGNYEVKKGSFISFKKIASTLMACPDMSTENAMKEVLDKTDNYSLSGNQLTLNKAKMAPLARFEAVSKPGGN